MKKYLSILVLLTMIIMSSCGGKKQSEQQEAAPKYLVLYYSQNGGATKTLAEEIQKLTGADIEAIEAEEPYDCDYQQTIERCLKERKDTIIPAVKPLKSDISQYDVVFLGYPIWFGTYARPIIGLLNSVDFSGKKIVPFSTFGSGGLESSAKDLKAALPNSEILEGYGVRNARLSAIPTEVYRFLVERDYIDGEVVALADYSEQQPVTEEEKAIFEAATSGYQFPLGTPVTAGKRGTENGVDYRFTAVAQLPNSGESTVTIYVTVPNDGTPEFTKVVR